MSMAAGLKAARALDARAHVVAVELLCAAQAIDLLAPLTTSPPLARRARLHPRARAGARGRPPAGARHRRDRPG
jgi:histidine ammonia-lyase